MKQNQPIRILHCVAGLDRGGYETFIMNVYRKIDRSQIQFDFLYSFDGVFTEEVKRLGGRLYKIPFITEKGPFAYRKNVMRFFREHPEYRIVHSHMDKFSGEIMVCAKRCGIPVRIAHSHSTKNEGGVLFQLIKNYYGKKIVRNCTDKFACSQKAGEWLFAEDPTSITVIRNGVDTGRFCPIERRDPQAFTVVHVGRFVPAKNHRFLVEIFAALHAAEPSAKLLLAGTGALQPDILARVKELGLSDAVSFLGDCGDIPGLLAKADVLCMPSLFEGLPVSLIETQAAGVPCVISTGIPTEADVTGTVDFLSLQASPEVWAQALIKYKGAPKHDNRTKIIASGYDIGATAEFLQQFYLQKANSR